MSPRRSKTLAAFGLFILAAALLGSALIGAAGRPVLSAPQNDLATEFVEWRFFGFGEMRRGNFPLWNPHVFAGTPFFGGFQSALLYPPNVIFLALPLDRAVNASIVLHVFGAGLALFLWATSRGMRPFAAFLSGAIFMLCGPVFPHVLAGHLSNLCALPWIPLVFLAVERLTGGHGAKWALLGVAAATCLVLAGHPQYVVYTAVALTAFLVIRLPDLVRPVPHLARLGAVAAIPFGATAVACVQLWAGVQEAQHGLRDAALPIDVAGSFSLPPENFVTLFAPTFFGAVSGESYWGRGYAWEMNLFLGVGAVVLAVLGAVEGRRDVRRSALAMITALLVLALGANTPLFELVLRWVPGLDRFRGLSKFAVFAAMFGALLAGAGFERLLDRERLRIRWPILALGLGASLLIVAAAIPRGPQAGSSGSDAWTRWMSAIRERGAEHHDSFVPPESLADPAFVAASTGGARWALFEAGLVGCLVAGLIAAARMRPIAAPFVGAVVLLELIRFAVPLRATFPLELVEFPALRERRAERGGDGRILNSVIPNSAMMLGASDVFGYDPGITRRYAEFLSFTQFGDALHLSSFPVLQNLSPRFSIVRLDEVLTLRDGRLLLVRPPTPPLPRFFAAESFEVLPERPALLARLFDDALDPSRTILLESDPGPGFAAVDSAASSDSTRSLGSFEVLEESTDAVVLRANVDRPTLLVMTDAYHPFWTATALPGSAQTAYEVMPADLVVRAIPLQAGEHRIRLEYRIPGMRAAAAISCASAAALVVIVSFAFVLQRRSRRSQRIP